MNWILRAAILVTFFAAAASAADEFPYTAYVAVERAEVVAGPGHRFYATEHLPRGTKLEVYREEASGWLAIRPAAEAFSWVSANFVERSAEDERLGRITEPTPSWIGTAVEQVREHRQQVTLKEGELIQILGEKSVAAKAGEETWLKIAPPAGEFRWIHLRDVSRQMPPPIESPPPAELENAEPDEPEPPAEPQRLEVAGPAMALDDIDRAGPRRGRVEPAQFQTSSPATKPISPDGFVPRKRRDGEHVAPQHVPAPLPASSAGRLRAPVGGAARIAEARPGFEQPAPVSSGSGGAGDDLAAQLERIELDLSLMVAQDKTLWDLASIKARARQLVDRGPDPAGRGQARLLLEKVEQFERAFAVQDYGPIRASAADAGSAAAARPAGGIEDPRYDAQGWLKPVISRQGDKPIAPYAVVDRDGQPQCFITPRPGVNLHRYENKQVGVYGRRGYLEQLKKPHVTAERVIDLDGQWR